MKRLSLVFRIHSCYFSRPAGLRALWREMIRNRHQRIVVLGLGNGDLAHRLLSFATRVNDSQVHFTGIDLFESAPESAQHLKFKEAFKRFQCRNGLVKLIPGDPLAALSRSANSLTGTELFLFDSGLPAESLQKAWKYVPRMLTERSAIFRVEPENTLARVEIRQVQEWAASAGPSARRAA